jgi:transcriptional regulator with XRE-family HTH domain
VAKTTDGGRLKKLRESFESVRIGLSRAELAVLTGLSEQMVYLWETDQRTMNLRDVRKLAAALKCEVTDLIG